MNYKLIPIKFIAFSALACIVIFIVENVNHRFWLNDFKVYYGGASSLLNGNPVYGNLFSLGSGYYKYSPFTALLFFPSCLFSFKTAAIIHFFILSLSIILLFIVAWNLINHYFFNGDLKNKNLLLVISFVCVGNHLFRELHLGNINVILLLLLCLTLGYQLRSKYFLAGMLLAIVIMAKPFFIILLLPLLLRKNFKTILSVCFFLFLFIILPSLFTGISKDVELHKEWIQIMLTHNASFPSYNTIENLILVYFGPQESNSLQLYVMIAFITCYLILFFINRLSEKKHSDNHPLKVTGFSIEWFTLIAIVPSLFRTDTQHFLLSFPLILLSLGYVSINKNTWLTIVFVILIFFYGGNISALIGKTFSTRLDEAGMLGISNLLILTGIICIYFNALKKPIKLS